MEIVRKFREVSHNTFYFEGYASSINEFCEYMEYSYDNNKEEYCLYEEFVLFPLGLLKFYVPNVFVSYSSIELLDGTNHASTHCNSNLSKFLNVCLAADICDAYGIEWEYSGKYNCYNKCGFVVFGQMSRPFCFITIPTETQFSQRDEMFDDAWLVENVPNEYAQKHALLVNNNPCMIDKIHPEWYISESSRNESEREFYDKHVKFNSILIKHSSSSNVFQDSGLAIRTWMSRSCVMNVNKTVKADKCFLEQYTVNAHYPLSHEFDDGIQPCVSVKMSLWDALTYEYDGGVTLPPIDFYSQYKNALWEYSLESHKGYMLRTAIKRNDHDEIIAICAIIMLELKAKQLKKQHKLCKKSTKSTPLQIQGDCSNTSSVQWTSWQTKKLHQMRRLQSANSLLRQITSSIMS